jgi:uncharacterized membrane protein
LYSIILSLFERGTHLSNQKTENNEGKIPPHADRPWLRPESRTFMRYICHQRPDRCFKINNKPMALCSRCFGFYLGFMVGLIIPLVLWWIYDLEILFLGFILIISLIPMGLDGLTQLMGYRESSNNLRFTTGIIAGVSLGMVLNWLLVHILILD